MTDCERCGREESFFLSVEDGYCYECRPACDGCGERVEDSRYADGYYFCPDCVVSCNNCGELITPGNLRVEDGCGYCYPYCYDCGESRPEDHRCFGELDHDYRYRPRMQFYGESRDGLYFGVELELESKGGYNGGDIADAVAAVDPHEEIWWVKEDGSLNNGAEIVSHPRSYRRWMQFPELDRMLAGVKQVGEARSSCGVHVHMSTEAFKRAHHLYRFLRFHYVTCTDLCIKVAGRYSDEWAAFLPGGGSEYWANDERLMRLFAQKKDTNASRYVACNLQNTDTIELRYFRSTVQSERVRMYIEWLHSVYEYTKHTRAAKMSEEGYRRWLKGRRYARVEKEIA